MADKSVKTTPEVVFGAGGIGGTSEGWFTKTWTDEKTVNELLEFLTAQKIKILDGASGYPPGNPGDTSRLLGLTKAASKGFIIDTKVSPTGMDSNGKFKPFLSPSLVDEIVIKDLALLKVDKVRCLYIHGDNLAEPIAEQAQAMDQQIKKGRCEMLGLSNYTVSRLTEYLTYCDQHSLTKPKIYQCHYNALIRDIEWKDGILDLCRRHGVNIYAYSPLAGGFLSGKFTASRDLAEEDRDKTMAESRWQSNTPFQMYLAQFDRPVLHKAMRNFVKACASQESPVEPAEVSLRWLLHHSALGSGDGIILGASKLSQISRSTEGFQKGPLPEVLRLATEALWVETEQDAISRGSMI